MRNKFAKNSVADFKLGRQDHLWPRMLTGFQVIIPRGMNFTRAQLYPLVAACQITRYRPVLHAWKALMLLCRFLFILDFTVTRIQLVILLDFISINTVFLFFSLNFFRILIGPMDLGLA